MYTIQWFVFIMGTIAVVWVSRAAFRRIPSHGFYRFFAWEIILILFALNVRYWINDPLSILQLVSWVLLVISLILILQGVRMFQKQGRIDVDRADSSLVSIEKTTELVTTGIYRYIRHPFYSSLLFLAWGTCFKQITWLTLLLAAAATLFLILTAKVEEGENIAYFGEQYRAYMQSTKMFIPFVL